MLCSGKENMFLLLVLAVRTHINHQDHPHRLLLGGCQRPRFIPRVDGRHWEVKDEP